MPIIDQTTPWLADVNLLHPGKRKFQPLDFFVIVFEVWVWWPAVCDFVVVRNFLDGLGRFQPWHVGPKVGTNKVSDALAKGFSFEKVYDLLGGWDVLEPDKDMKVEGSSALRFDGTEVGGNPTKYTDLGLHLSGCQQLHPTH